MNKLTEIKEAKEEYEAKGFMPHIESVGEIERVSCEFHNKAYDRISYLISLLEEKDKALEESQKQNEILRTNAKYTADALWEALQTIARQREALTRINELHVRGIEDKVCEPFRQIAKAALEGSNQA